jgi:hypothetical protein
MYFQKVGCEGTEWIGVVQDRDVVGSCEYGNEPPGSKKMRGISGLTENRLASQEELCVMK